MGDIIDDINRITKPPKKYGGYANSQEREPIDESVSVGLETAAEQTAGGTETGVTRTENIAQRTLHTALHYLTSSDGLIVLEEQNVNEVHFVDEIGVETTDIYGDPA